MHRLRFVHAGPLQLELTPRGVAQVSEALSTKLIDAPYESAKAVFRSAIEHQADFVLLPGGVCDFGRAGPRAFAFLMEQFEELARQQVAVYWALGGVDLRCSWPEELPLPPNVRLFAHRNVERAMHARGHEPVANVLGCCHEQREPLGAGTFRPADNGLFTIALCHAMPPVAAAGEHLPEYYALGGAQRRETQNVEKSIAHDPGSPLGRRPAHSGTHGCTLATVNEQGDCELKLIATDVLRFQRESLLPGPALAQEELLPQLRRRAQQLLDGHRGPELLVTWSVTGSPALTSEASQLSESNRALDLLNAEFGPRSPGLWSIGIERAVGSASATELPAADTLLGEFLRIAHAREVEPDAGIALDNFLGEHAGDERLKELREIADVERRRRVLREVARLGKELLGAEESVA